MSDDANDDPQTDFSIYAAATGAVRLSGHAPRSMLAIQPLRAGEVLVEERVPFDTHYLDVSVTPPSATVRPALAGFDKAAIKADGSDAATMKLPISATIMIDNVAHQVTAGPLVFTADSAGIYRFAINAFPYLPFAAEITAS